MSSCSSVFPSLLHLFPSSGCSRVKGQGLGRLELRQSLPLSSVFALSWLCESVVMVGLLWVHISGCFRDVLVLSETPMRTFYLMPSPGDLSEPYPSSSAGRPRIVLGSVLSGGAQLPSERSLSPAGEVHTSKVHSQSCPSSSHPGSCRQPPLASPGEGRAAGNALWSRNSPGLAPEQCFAWGWEPFPFLSLIFPPGVGKGCCWAHLCSNFRQRTTSHTPVHP